MFAVVTRLEAVDAVNRDRFAKRELGARQQRLEECFTIIITTTIMTHYDDSPIIPVAHPTTERLWLSPRLSVSTKPEAVSLEP